MHIEVSKRKEAETDSHFWEGFVHCREGGFGNMCAVLDVVEDSLEGMIRQLEVAMPELVKGD